MYNSAGWFLTEIAGVLLLGRQDNEQLIKSMIYVNPARLAARLVNGK